MGKKEALKIFEDKNVRVIWDDEQEEWYFSVVDVVEVLTDSVNPTDYLKKMRKREPELNTYLGTNCPLILMTTQTGKRRKTLAANPEHLFRIIQSIPSPKAEPFKQWMAQVAAERLDQIPVITSLNAKDYFNSIEGKKQRQIEDNNNDK